MKRIAAVLLAAVLVVLAGCTGGVPGTGDGTTVTGDGDADGDATDGAETDGDATNSGTVSFYVSDEPNDIDDFEHLNVTVTTVAFHRVDASADDATDADGGDDADDADDGDGDGEWLTYDAGNQTVDLTELQGKNASAVADFNVPNGTYTQVRLTVSEVNGTLADGSAQRVKLPSDRLKISERFTVGDGEEVDFVFDITVHRAGKSGKYILKPVVSESGTDVPIQTVDRDDDGDGLRAHFVGRAAAGERTTVKVVGDRGPVEGATVTVNGERVGTTDAKGTATFDVPADAEEVEVEVTHDDREAELTAKFGLGDDDRDRDDADEGDEGESDAESDEDEPGDDADGDGSTVSDDDSSLAVSAVGQGSASGSVILEVTMDGEVVQGADVVIDGEVVARTDADGRAIVQVPDDPDEISVETQGGESVDLTGELYVPVHATTQKGS